MTIVVVDDESESRTLLTAILAAEGYEVRTADSGNLALASIAAHLPELILLDIRMPGMDGFEVCRRLKERAETRDIPLIFLSASLQLSERVEGLRLGSVDFVTKPFQRDELLARVRTHLELGRLRAHLEQQVAERTAELRESEERFRNMADTAPVLIWVSGTDKLCIFFNKGWLEFTGRRLDEELGNGWAAGLHPDDLERCYATYSSSFDARRAFQMEYRLRGGDGEYRWLLEKGVPRFSANGVFEGYIGSGIDITEQKRADAEQRRSLDEIAHLNRVAAIGELTASLAHELNQPLAAILGNAQAASRILSGESADLAEVRECLTDIVADDKRAGEIINRLRGLLKKEAFQESSIDLNEVVSDALRLVRNDSLLRRVTMKFEPSPGLPPVLGDRVQLYQVVLNLIVNGLGAAEEGGRWASAGCWCGRPKRLLEASN